MTYEEHIKPILREHCLKCHGEDEQKAELNQQTHASTLKGGSAGGAVVAGRSSQSLLFQVITDPNDGVRMPPKKAAIPQAQIAMIKQWIDSGLRETSASKSMVAERDPSFKPAAGAGAKPAAPALPENLPVVSVPKTLRPLPVPVAEPCRVVKPSRLACSAHSAFRWAICFDCRHRRRTGNP